MGNNPNTKKNSKGLRKPPPTKEQLEWRELVKEDRALFQEQNHERFTAALAMENSEKNRYVSVLAVETSRVKLQGGNNGDYINANFVDGISPGAVGNYIAAQAPLPNTLEDFWRMIWEQKVTVIVMLTNLVENNILKANQYWPSVGTKKFGTFSVTKMEVTETESYVLRTFRLKEGATGSLKDNTQAPPAGNGKKSEARLICQYHYKIWPDHGVPTEATSLLQMMAEVETYHSAHRVDSGRGHAHVTSPLLVHCSAGIGRTGSYIVIDSILRSLRESYGLKIGEKSSITALYDELVELSLKETVSSMRQQRVGFVQQRPQYLFCYRAIREALLRLESSSSSSSPSPPSPPRAKVSLAKD